MILSEIEYLEKGNIDRNETSFTLSAETFADRNIRGFRRFEPFSVNFFNFNFFDENSVKG